MNDLQRNFATAGMVCAASASLIGGIYFRQKVETQSIALQSGDLLAPGLVASRIEVPEERYFYDLTALLRREYVDPIGEEGKLATGAVKGMISSLDDERSLFMSEPVFRADVNSLQGRYEGIGVNLVLIRDPGNPVKTIRTSLDFLKRVPRVRVAFVVPGGPADRAGLKAGDEIDTIDSRWVISPEIGERYRRIDSEVKANKRPEQARIDVQNEMRKKFQNSMMPVRAIERLIVGDEGHLELKWKRAGKLMEGRLIKTPSKVAVNEGSPFRLSFVPGADAALASQLQKNPESAIDLRGAGSGDIKVMVQCLSKLAPAGTYGQIVKDKGAGQPVKVLEGARVGKDVKPVRILVDRETRGLAEAFVLALRSKGLARTEGGPMAGDPSIVERTSMPDRSGFTLRVGVFRAAGGAS